MKVLILAAGYGTRLRAIGENTPKPLLDINGRPLINYILDKLENLNGLNEVIVVTNNKFYSVFCDWKDGISFPHPITIVNDGTNTPDDRLGSIGDINFVLEHKTMDDDFLIVGGDNLFDYNVNEYIMFAQNKPQAVTMGTYDVGDVAQAQLFGVVELDADNKIISFEEKPACPKSSLISMCFYYLPQKTLGLVAAYLNEVKQSDTSGDYIRWLREKNEVYGFQFVGTWYDIGSIEAYRDAQAKFKNKS